jgi:ribosomal protein S18 acetylase RimI-like enzyme
VIELARGLSSRALSALRELEERTVAEDGGRLKLEWGVLKTRSGEDVDDLLWWDGDRLLGFVGLYGFGSPTVELAGMVDPAARRRGIATTLLDSALRICRDRGCQRVLLVTPRASAGGGAFAVARGAVLEHSEHALLLLDAPTDGPARPDIVLRTATPGDVGEISRLLTVGFGAPHPVRVEKLASDSERTLVVKRAGSVVGTVRLSRDEHHAGVYGFVVDPAWQGRGIGRNVLRRACLQLRDEGATRIALEVAVENDHALGLYTSLGFTRIATEDYYALPCE